MPDTTLTLSNIKDHLRRYKVVYIVFIVLAVVGADLLWTTTTPQIPEEQRVLIYLADAYTDPAPLNAMADELLEKARAFDPTLEQIRFESLMFTDPDTDYTGMMVLMARLAAGEGDLFFAGPDAMAALTQAGACLPLDDALSAGWMAGQGLEPHYGEIVDPDTGETTTLLAGLKLDNLNALINMKAFKNEGGCLAVAANGTNMETSMKVAEMIVEALRGEADAGA